MTEFEIHIPARKKAVVSERDMAVKVTGEAYLWEVRVVQSRLQTIMRSYYLKSKFLVTFHILLEVKEHSINTLRMRPQTGIKAHELAILMRLGFGGSVRLAAVPMSPSVL